jgi:hypothetical protein
MKRLLRLTLAATFGFYTFAPVEANSSDFFCSDVTCLIAAMNEANTIGGVNTINLDPGSYTLTSVNNVQQGANGLPLVTNELTINGVDAATTIIERDSAAPQFRIFDVAANGSLTLNGLTVKGGSIVFGVGGGIQNSGTLNVSHSIIERNFALPGGGIFNSGTLSLTHSILALNTAQGGGALLNVGTGTGVITHVTIFDNLATGGGGIENGGTMTIQNSTINSNSADGAGGISNRGMMEIKNTTVADNFIRFFQGAGVENSGTLKITNSTIADNVAGFPGATAVPTGGGIANSAGVLELQNTIVALNTVNSLNPNAAPDCSGTITSLGNNIIGDLKGCDITLAAGDLVTDPGLADFADDGTPGGGHFPLLENSPAIDKGNDEVCSADPELSTDQLGQSRVGPCDIGAVEFEGALTIVTDVRPRRGPPNRINPNSTKNINVALLSGDGFDATLIDPSTVRLGATGVEAAPILFRLRDVNGDGQRDLIVRFQIPDLGIECGASSLTLTGQIPGGHSIISSSAITTTGCK